MQEFEMTQEEVDELKDLGKKAQEAPVMRMSMNSPCFSEMAYDNLWAKWKEMGKKYGFVWDSAKPSPKGDQFVMAKPTG